MALGRHFRSSVIISGLIIIILLIFYMHPSRRLVRSVQELSVYLLLLLACLSHKPIRETFLGLSTYRIALLLTFFSLAIAGQLYNVGTRTYPFIPWGMYSEVDPDREFVKYEAVLGSEKTIDFPFRHVSPSSSPRAFAESFDRRALLMARMKEGEPPIKGNNKIVAELGNPLSAVARLYNRRYPSDPIRSVHVSVCSVSIAGDQGSSILGCQPVAILGIE
jgi:hypothetical protein